MLFLSAFSEKYDEYDLLWKMIKESINEGELYYSTLKELNANLGSKDKKLMRHQIKVINKSFDVSVLISFYL